MQKISNVSVPDRMKVLVEAPSPSGTELSILVYELKLLI